MDIRNRRGMKSAAAQALAANPGQPRLVVLAYTGATAGSILLTAALTGLMLSRVNATSGLGDLGLRSILSTIQLCLPIALALFLWGIQLGYQKTALAMARRQTVQPRDLLDGFRFFGPLLRATLLLGLIFMMLDFVTSQVASILFLMTPFFDNFAAAQEAVFGDSSILSSAVQTDVESLLEYYKAMIPMLCIWLPMFCFTAGPFFYSCRMINYVILDRPGTGALMAMGESGRMMHGSRGALFKVDLGYWWFHLAHFLLNSFLFGSMLVLMLGLSASVTKTLIICGMMAVCLLVQGVLNFFFMNRVETTYATVYDTLRPKPRETQGGAVLGNIFDLARDYRED